MTPTIMRTVGTVVAVLLAVSLAPPADAVTSPHESPPPQSQLRVVSWNICGEAGGSRGDAGYCPYRNEPSVKIDRLVDLVEQQNVNVIMLQEVCAETSDSHLGLLQTALGDEWQIGHAKGARPDGRTDCRGDLNGELGVGIAVKAPDATFDSRNMVPSGGNLQTLPILCASTTAWTTRVCTTHLLSDPADPRRPGQVANVVDYVKDSRRDLVLGGDFNMFPGSADLDPIAGMFDECDQRAYSEDDPSNEVTHHAWDGTDHVFRKRDHIFATKSGTSRFSFCDSRTELMDQTANEPDSGPPSGYSDHAPLLATWAPPRPARR